MAIGKKQRKQLLTALKFVISALLIYFIFTKIKPQEIAEVLADAHWGLLFLALVLVALSKLISALRLEMYFHQIEAFIQRLDNLKLYLLGMFYNLFLPGGIGGDAYKGYVIQKVFPVKTKRVVSVLLLDRLSGMLVLFLFACIIGLLLPTELWQGWSWLFWLALPSSIAVFWWLNKKFFFYVLPIFWKSTAYSIGVQGSQLLAILCILYALGIDQQHLPYLLVFLVSSIVSVLPLTIGGIGSREVTFLYGSLWLGLDQDKSISISLVFFLIQALISLAGIYYHLKKPVTIPPEEQQ